jgi:hypothetical protein
VSQDLVLILIKWGREGGELRGSIVILIDMNGKISLQFVCSVCFSLFWFVCFRCLIWVLGFFCRRWFSSVGESVAGLVFLVDFNVPSCRPWFFWSCFFFSHTSSRYRSSRSLHRLRLFIWCPGAALGGLFLLHLLSPTQAARFCLFHACGCIFCFPLSA